MKYTLHVKNIDQGNHEFEAYLAKRLKALQKIVKDDAVLAAVELSKTTNHHQGGDIFRSEITFSAFGREFFAASEREDLKAAIDEMKDEIVMEMKRAKGKTETAFRRGARRMKNILKGLDPREYNYRDLLVWEKWRKGKGK